MRGRGSLLGRYYGFCIPRASTRAGAHRRNRLESRSVPGSGRTVRARAAVALAGKDGRLEEWEGSWDIAAASDDPAAALRRKARPASHRPASHLPAPHRPAPHRPAPGRPKRRAQYSRPAIHPRRPRPRPPTPRILPTFQSPLQSTPPTRPPTPRRPPLPPASLHRPTVRIMEHFMHYPGCISGGNCSSCASSKARPVVSVSPRHRCPSGAAPSAGPRPECVGRRRLSCRWAPAGASGSSRCNGWCSAPSA
jgi:hypothetical protein